MATNAPVDPEQGQWLKQVVTGYFAYHAVPTNIEALRAFRFHVVSLWGRALRRRSQKDGTTWKRILKIADEFLPKPRILHPWPISASPSNTRGRSRVPEWGTLGSVRGDASNGIPYRDVRRETARSRW